MEHKEFPYLYMKSAAEAKGYDELDRWRESYKVNLACKKAIEEAIRQDFDGMHLKEGCVQRIISEYGFKRMEWVLANTVQQKPGDGRFRPDNRKWADSFFIPEENHNADFVVNSHSEVLNGFIQGFRQEYDNLQLFGPDHCEYISGQELKGKALVLSARTLKESYWTQENQLWLATEGFGCSPTASGRAVYAICRDAPPKDYHGHVMALSDVVELYDRHGSSFYYCDRIGFREISFQPQEQGSCMKMSL